MASLTAVQARQGEKDVRFFLFFYILASLMLLWRSFLLNSQRAQSMDDPMHLRCGC
jgi:hypothetical protein